LKHLLRLLCVFLLASGTASADSSPLRFGITPATARNQYALFEDWRVYLEQKLTRPVEFVVRENLQESIFLMRQKKLDFAWVSSPAYIENKQQTTLLATPVYHGQPLNRAFLIVPASDTHTRSLLDLKGKIFVYVDPMSYVGYLEPRYQLVLAGEDPDQFFKKTFFTRDQLKVVAAVAVGLADGGTISGFAWETLALSRPDITGQTRIVAKSPPYGFPPIIARRTLKQRDFTRMQGVLLGMSADPAGISLLKRLNLDGFTTADEKRYRSVSVMMQRMEDK